MAKPKSITLDLTGEFTKSLCAKLDKAERQRDFLLEEMRAIADGEWVTDSSAQEIAKEALSQLGGVGEEAERGKQA
jgi:hypothetical protein